jgi:cytochrome c oxidase subunit 3
MHDQAHVPPQNHAGDHGHDHPPFLAHHWDNPKQQFEAGKLGMWLFLATEVLLFGGLFCAYSVWRHSHPELFRFGSKFLDTRMGAINTAVLILSSLTMAWGVTAAQQNKQGLLKLMLVLTLCGATGFLVIKYFEYSHKFHEGYYPGIKFYERPSEHSSYWETRKQLEHDVGRGTTSGGGTMVNPPPMESPVPTRKDDAGPDAGIAHGAAPAATAPQLTPAAGMPAVEASSVLPANIGPAGLKPNAQLVEQPFHMHQRHGGDELHPLNDPHRPANAHMFFNIYFMMTGLHGIHVVVGMIVIIWLLIRTMRGDFSAEYFTPIDLGGLYWHIVDLIWIFLFPLFYLI